MDALKDMFGTDFYKILGKEITRAHKNFNTRLFIQHVTAGAEDLSLNQRMRRTSVVLHEMLPGPYTHTLAVLKDVIQGMPGGYTNLLFPDYVGQYGKHDHKSSMEALRYFTSYGSSEFAIREFLKHDFDKTIRVMYTWAENDNYHVRRLASEGSRPRLPWSFKLDKVIQHPEVTRPILETLKRDDHLYVRKSVANHLNDFSKDQTEFMLSVVKGWDMEHPHTGWIVKHACRSLIKKGNTEALQLFSFEKNIKIKVVDLKITPSVVKIGGDAQFSFDIQSAARTQQKLAVDFVVHYVKKGGERSAKVFKLKELHLPAGEEVFFTRKISFKDLTTRSHHKGQHLLEIQVNGKRYAQTDFMLV